MQIRVNGKEHEIAATTLAELLHELGYRDKIVGTAVNHMFVRAAERPTTPVQAGDIIEILTPRQGG